MCRQSDKVETWRVQELGSLFEERYWIVAWRKGCGKGEGRSRLVGGTGRGRGLWHGICFWSVSGFEILIIG
jgi:hypothetical protein